LINATSEEREILRADLKDAGILHDDTIFQELRS
jgi:hypothetical protein